jgi:hypothetical protein
VAVCPPGHEATGRWTEEEHAKFMEACIAARAKGWGQAAAAVGTRSAVQVRTHAQKHFHFHKTTYRHARKAGPAAAAAHTGTGG